MWGVISSVLNLPRFTEMANAGQRTDCGALSRMGTLCQAVPVTLMDVHETKNPGDKRDVAVTIVAIGINRERRNNAD
jgi:hypothetical protein